MKPAHRPLNFKSNWEAQYYEHLRARKQAGEIIEFSYESIRLRISDKGFYTPDFIVILENEIQFHEVKGQRREAGMVRIRTAAYQHRWTRFLLVTKKRNSWIIEEIP